ncbi:MAG: tetratricopeptide repeat protein [Flavobacteriales bacterium]|nr:tetratricopeptide repeat protein [Flavobacteriales bacterium]
MGSPVRLPMPGPLRCILCLIGFLRVSIGPAQDSNLQAYQFCMDSCNTAELAGTYERALLLLDRAKTLADSAEDTLRRADVLVKRGVIRQRQGDYNAALGHFYEALHLYESIDHHAGLAEVYNDIGSVHHYDKNYVKAREYYTLSLRLREEHGTPAQLAILYNNFGALLEDLDRPDSALSFHRKCLAIRTQQRDTSWMAVCFMNIGACHKLLDANDSARIYLLRAKELLRVMPNRYLHGSVDYRLGSVDLADGRPADAARHCGDALAVAMDLKLAPLMQHCYACLHEAYGRLGDAPRAYSLLKRYVALRDSMFGEERVKELTRIEMNHAFERQQFADSVVQADLLRKADQAYREGLARERDQRNIFLFSAIAVLGVAGGLWSRLRYMRRSRSMVQRERERSDQLLLNILPRGIAEELKEHGQAQARDVDGVSILFTDFADFTPLSAGLTAQELVATIHTCFTAFDAIVARHGLEKIKTIGDAYMAAGGLPEPRTGSARDTVLAALEMQDYMIAFNKARPPGTPAFAMRAGIHTGDVVAGIVGRDKFQYDIWGEPVNVASRMESGGAVDQVNISGTTYLLVKDDPALQFIPRGDLYVKGRGELTMYFVSRR